jgi:transcriptional regulator of acetoin/glycerol metabolism
LENIIARTVALAEGDQVQLHDLPPHLSKTVELRDTRLSSLEDIERDHIAMVLRTVSGQREKAAAILGITRSTLWRKMKKFNLTF